jgi:hypothetical protein
MSFGGGKSMNSEHLALYRQLSETKIYRERFGEWKYADRYLNPKRSKCYYYTSIFDDTMTSYCIWLPPVFDPENPERCLWGMVDWNRFIPYISPEGNMTIMQVNGLSPDRLDIALIKAIVAQDKEETMDAD